MHRFTAHVKDRVLRGTHGEEGQPDWHLLTGTIAAEGRAELKLDGIVANPKNAVNNAYRGKLYSYRVRASFSATTGPDSESADASAPLISAAAKLLWVESCTAGRVSKPALRTFHGHTAISLESGKAFTTAQGCRGDSSQATFG